MGSASSRLATSNFPAPRSLAFLDWTGRKAVGPGGPEYQSAPSGGSAESYTRRFDIGASKLLNLTFNLPTATKAIIVASIVKKHSLCRDMAALLTGNHVFFPNTHAHRVKL